MEITTLRVYGVNEALVAMRNPHQSWGNSDTFDSLYIGEKDKDLSAKLVKNGPPHDKHMRFIQVHASISAPLFWWKQFDTYRMGVEKLSESTMYCITKWPFELMNFEVPTLKDAVWIRDVILPRLNSLRDAYLVTDDPEEKENYFYTIISDLPSSYVQTRSVMISYAALGQMIRQRKKHKLGQWSTTFMNWVRTLPHFELLEPYFED